MKVISHLYYLKPNYSIVNKNELGMFIRLRKDEQKSLSVEYSKLPKARKKMLAKIKKK